MQKLLLFEQAADATPVFCGALLVQSNLDALVVSSRKLVGGLGRAFHISIDGTSKNLREIEDYQEIPIGPDIPPFLYRIKLRDS